MASKTLRLAFMGTPSYALPTLEALYGAGHEIKMIWTKPPRKKDRGLKRTSGAVAGWANEHRIPLREKNNLDDREEFRLFSSLDLDAAIIVSFGIFLPKDFLTAPRLGCLNLHPSLLPRWRGAAPIERALWAGDEETGITIMLLDEGMDDGDILAQKKIMIGEMNAGALRERTSREGARLMVETLEKFSRGEITPQPQDHAQASLAPRLTAAEEKINWHRSARELLCQIRALSPSPGGWSFCPKREKNSKEKKGEEKKIRLRFLDATITANEGEAGRVLNAKEGIIACGEQSLKIKIFQREGRRALAAAAFLRGFPLYDGERLD